MGMIPRSRVDKEGYIFLLTTRSEIATMGARRLVAGVPGEHVRD